MLDAFNSFMKALFEPVFVLALLGTGRLLWQWRDGRRIAPGMALMAAFFLFAGTWRILLNINSSRYSLSAMIPATVLAAWWMYDWVSAGWRNWPRRPFRVAAASLVLTGIVVAAGVTELRNERDAYRAFLQLGGVLRQFLMDGKNPGFFFLSEHGKRFSYYANASEWPTPPTHYTFSGTSDYSEALLRALERHDRLAVIVPAAQEEILRERLRKITGAETPPVSLGTFAQRRKPIRVLGVDNRDAPSFGRRSLAELPPRPTSAELLIAENFEHPRVVTVARDPILSLYRRLGFRFALADTILQPEKMGLENHGNVLSAEKVGAEFQVVRRGTESRNSVLVSRSSTCHLMRMRGIVRRHRAYLVEFRVRGERGSRVEICQMRYQGRTYRGEQRNAGNFYALDGDLRYCRLRLTDPGEAADNLVFSWYLYGSLELDDIKIYGIR